MKQAGNCGV